MAHQLDPKGREGTLNSLSMCKCFYYIPKSHLLYVGANSPLRLKKKKKALLGRLLVLSEITSTIKGSRVTWTKVRDLNIQCPCTESSFRL